jgi:hypothetical protein
MHPAPHTAIPAPRAIAATRSRSPGGCSGPLAAAAPLAGSNAPLDSTAAFQVADESRTGVLGAVAEANPVRG